MKRLWTWIITVGMILIAIGVLMPVMGYGMELCRWIYGAGAVLTLAGRIMTPYRGDNLRVKRLCRIEVWSSVFFCAGAFFMFYQGGSGRDWLAFTLAGGAVLIYTSIMIPRAEKNRSN
ncbi:MAG: hypothetical protein K1V87_02845 [Muribaculum sp.]